MSRRGGWKREVKGVGLENRLKGREGKRGSKQGEWNGRSLERRKGRGTEKGQRRVNSGMEGKRNEY